VPYDPETGYMPDFSAWGPLRAEKEAEWRAKQRTAGVLAQDTAARSAQDADYATWRGAQDFSAQDAAFGDISAADAQMMADLTGYRDILPDVPRLGLRQISGEGGRAFSALAGQAGAMPIGGGSAASLRQGGLETGLAQAGFLAEALPGAAAARSDASGQILQSLLDKQARGVGGVTEAINQARNIMDEHKSGGVFAKSSNRAKATAELQALAEAATNPAVRKIYLDKLDDLNRYV